MSLNPPVHQRLETRHRSRGCVSWAAGAMVLAVAPRVMGFRPMTPLATSWATSHGGSDSAANVAPRQRASTVAGRARFCRDRWACKLKCGETESRGRGEGEVGSIGSDEANNWGFDDSIDVNAIRMKMMEQAGYKKRGKADAGNEWIVVDEDGDGETVDRIKEAVADSLHSELMGKGSLKESEASSLVDEVLQDTDLAKFFDEEFEKGTSALKALAQELKTDKETVSYADKMAEELADLLQAEEDRAAKEIERRQAPVKAKLDKATTELEEAMAAAEEARREFEGDFMLQLMSFRQKGVLRQGAFVAAIMIANQAVYQAFLLSDDRGGDPGITLGGLVASAALVWFYGYRPLKL